MWIGVPCPRCRKDVCQPSARVEQRGTQDFQVISEAVCNNCHNVYDMVKWQIWCFVVEVENERDEMQR